MDISRSIESESARYGPRSIQGLRARSNPASQPIKASARLTGFFHSSRMVLDVGRKRQSCFNKPREDARADWKDVVVKYEVGVMDGRRPLVTEPEISPRLRVQHVREILTAGLRTGRRRHILTADDFARYTRDDVGMFVRIHQNREDVTDIG